MSGSQKIVAKGFKEGLCKLVGRLVGWLVGCIRFFLHPSVHPRTYMLQCEREATMVGGLEQVGGGSMCFLSSLHS